MSPPPAPTRRPSPPSPAARAPSDRPGDLVLVEDHPDHADLIEVLLKRAPGGRWTVRRAATLKEADHLVAERRPEVVLLDINLPDSRGLATVERFCESHPDVPVVVATSHEPEAGVEAVRRGAQDFLVKGAFDAALLTRSLRLAIARKEGQQAAEALRASEERYRRLFESNPQPMWVYDSRSLRFLAVNDAALQQYGFLRDEFLAMTIRDIRPPSGEAALDRRLREETAGARSTTTRHRRRDGTEFDVEVASRPIVLDGREGRLVVAADVTEHRRVETQLRQAQKMEALGRLASGVSHDFNNLLGVITGYSELALRAAERDSVLARRIEEIRKAAARAAELTTQLLAFSRQQVLEPRVVDLNAVVTEAERMLRRLIGEDIQLSTSLAPDLGHVRADPGQLTQIVLNLAVNARDALPRGGRLLVETSNVELDARYHLAPSEAAPRRCVMLCVTDTGVGMDAETRGRLFEPFFTTKPAGQGTGLGLATVYGIDRQSGGHIAVYSEPGHGTAFRIYLPRVDDAVAEGLEPSPPLRRGRGETVLLVEDDTALREMTCEVLQEGGYEVLLASSGDEALERTASARVDLVVTDVVMPGLTGPELSRRLASLRPGLRVLFMSGYTEGAVLDLGALAGEVAFVSKPFTPDHLLSRVREVLDAPSRPEAG